MATRSQEEPASPGVPRKTEEDQSRRARYGNFSKAPKNGNSECFKKTSPPSSFELLSHHCCRLSLGPGTRPRVRVAPDLLPELSRPPRRRLASSQPESGRRLAHRL